MRRRVFTSFHYIPDNWRASQIRNMGKIEGNGIVSANKWEPKGVIKLSKNG